MSVGRSFGAHACMFLFPTTTSALDCFKPGGLFINTGFVYKHCVSVYRAFIVLGLLDLLVVFYVYYRYLTPVFLSYTCCWLCVCSYSLMFSVVMSTGKRWRGGGGAKVLA